MKAKTLFASMVAASLLMSAAQSAWAEDDANPAAFARALSQANVSLAQALQTSEHEGKPISAKFELEDGVLQLSVYTSKGSSFKEVIVDHKSGAIKKTETITEADDLKAATVQHQTLAKAKVSLGKAVEMAVGTNANARAVSVMPLLKVGHPVAEVTLLTGGNLKKVTENLD